VPATVWCQMQICRLFAMSFFGVARWTGAFSLSVRLRPVNVAQVPSKRRTQASDSLLNMRSPVRRKGFYHPSLTKDAFYPLRP